MTHPLDALRRALDAKYAAMTPEQLVEFNAAVASRVAAMQLKRAQDTAPPAEG